MGDVEESLVSDGYRQNYGSFITNETGNCLYRDTTDESYTVLQKRQRKLVVVVLLCVLIVTASTISWGVLSLQARFLPAQVHGTPQSPSDSKDEFLTPVAVIEHQTLWPSADRPVFDKGGAVIDRENGNFVE